MDPFMNPAYILFAAVAPLLIAFIKQKGFSKQINALIALACYFVIGLLGILLSGEALTLENAVNLIAIVTVVGTAAYNLVWTNIGSSDIYLNGLDERLTVKTSLVK
jgi:hypothetical protein